jgi:3-octaprenyl-4-hydroxybenzoate carboxy-lyase
MALRVIPTRIVGVPKSNQFAEFGTGRIGVSQASEAGLKLVQSGYGGLRGWISQVEQMGELVRVNGASWDAEMGAITHMLTEHSHGMAPALLFDEIPGYPKGYRTLYGHFSSVKRVALTLGLPLERERKVDIVKQYYNRIQTMKHILPRTVKDGPVLQNVLEGDKIDVLKFPVPRHHELDKARYIGTANCVITQDPMPAGSISAAIAIRSMTAKPSAVRSPRANTAASTATNISRAGRR